MIQPPVVRPVAGTPGRPITSERRETLKTTPTAAVDSPAGMRPGGGKN
jgi:hypothetical protein